MWTLSQGQRGPGRAGGQGELGQVCSKQVAMGVPAGQQARPWGRPAADSSSPVPSPGLGGGGRGQQVTTDMSAESQSGTH